MNLLIALLVVMASSTLAYVLGMATAVARMVPAMLAQGWTAPQPSKSENPWRKS